MARRLSFNLAAAISAQIIRYGAPLAFYPYLTRTMGTDSFAKFALAFAAAAMLGQVIEFGFGLSGGRTLASSPNAATESAAVAGDILMGRIVTSSVTIGATLAINAMLPEPVFDSVLFMTSIALLATGYGFSSSWYFIGYERGADLAGLELLTSLSQLVLIFAFVRTDSPSWLPVLLMSLPVWSVAAAGHALAYRHIGLIRPSWPRLRVKLLESFRFFCFTGTMPLANRANLLVLGLMADPKQVAYYAVGERIVTAAGNATIPIVRVVMPRIITLLNDRPNEAYKIFRRAVGGVTLLTAGGSAIAAVLSPWLVPFVFGKDMAPGASVVMLQLLAVPLIIASRLGGTLGLVPLRQDRAYQGVVLVTALGGFAVAPISIWIGGAYGLASARLAAEIALAAAVWLMLKSRRQHWGAAPATT